MKFTVDSSLKELHQEQVCGSTKIASSYISSKSANNALGEGGQWPE